MTETDKIVIRICALCVQGAKREDYLLLLQHIEDDELNALMELLDFTKGTLQELCDEVYTKDWRPLLQPRKYLLENDATYKELNLDQPVRA